MKKVESYYQGGYGVENTATGEILNADWKLDQMLLSLQQLSGQISLYHQKKYVQTFETFEF